MITSHFIKKYLRYNIVGILGTSLYLLILFTLVDLLHCRPTISSVFAFCINVIFNFVFSYFWVFKVKLQYRRVFTKFILVSLIGLGLNTVIMWVVVDLLKWPYYFAVIVASFVLPLSNFLLHHFWSFRAVTTERHKEKKGFIGVAK